jgi:hypothetical protein
LLGVFCSFNTRLFKITLVIGTNFGGISAGCTGFFKIAIHGLATFFENSTNAWRYDFGHNQIACTK